MAGRREGGDLDAGVSGVDNGERERILDEVGLAAGFEEREPEGRAIRCGESRTVLAHGVFVATPRFGERLSGGQPQPTELVVGDAQREQPTRWSDRPRDDAVAEVERLVGTTSIERSRLQLGRAVPDPASIQRTRDSSKRREIA